VLDILAFVKRNCTTWDRKRRQGESLTSDVGGKYCCLFALYMDRGYSPQQFVALFGEDGAAALEVERMFKADFGSKCHVAIVVNAAAAAYKL